MFGPNPIWRRALAPALLLAAICSTGNAMAFTMVDIKTRLVQLGYDPGPINEDWNERVSDACLRYKMEHGRLITDDLNVPAPAITAVVAPPAGGQGATVPAIRRVAVVENNGDETRSGRGKRIAEGFGRFATAILGGVVEYKTQQAQHTGGYTGTVAAPPRPARTDNFRARHLSNWGEWSASATVGGSPALELCVWDTECEDGDILKVSVNGSSVMRVELANGPQCRVVPFFPGTNTIAITAVNGTGYKGNCDFSDTNTGAISVSDARPGGASATQEWSVRGGAGSESSIRVQVAP